MKHQIKYLSEQQKKSFFGTCVENPFGSLSRLETVIDDAKEISKKVFLKNCDVESDVLAQMKRFPNDYEYYKYKHIYFFTWSAIEHFYK